ncbi:MAG: 4Fe-4S ferredoxin, partial [Deltaproteobacteria bacterium]|nr:4Fe-4S ferredoxin [Deltaproteobacteria bacterium]
MDAIVEKIRHTAKELLSEGKVEAVYGFAQSSQPMGCRPYVARTPEEADNLWWDSFCVMNTANFIPRRTGKKLAVVAQGCVSRNLVVLHLEKQIDLDEEIFVLGVPSQGMIDAEKIRQAVGSPDITEVTENGQEVRVKGLGFDKTLKRKDLLRDSCSTCRYHNPVVCNEWMAPQTQDEPDRDKDTRIREIEALSPRDKQQFFTELLSRCIRCYACRNACPLCYCEVCFVDESKPQWLGKSTETADTLTFHFLRAFHCAGRCTDCGACESACPVNIPVRLLTRKLEKDIEEAYGYQVGLDKKATPPMSVFQPDDP